MSRSTLVSVNILDALNQYHMEDISERPDSVVKAPSLATSLATRRTRMLYLCSAGMTRINICRVAWVCRWYDACDHWYTARFEPHGVGEASKCPHHSVDPLGIEPFECLEGDHNGLIITRSSHACPRTRISGSPRINLNPSRSPAPDNYTTLRRHSPEEVDPVDGGNGAYPEASGHSVEHHSTVLPAHEPEKQQRRVRQREPPQLTHQERHGQ